MHIKSSRLVHIGALRYFYEAARAGSIRGGSERVHTVPSAVTRQIGLLEQEFGTQLLERGRGRKGGVRLTLAGEILLGRYENALAELDAARSEIDAVRLIDAGRISLGVTYSVAREFIPGILKVFGTNYPGVDFSVIAESGIRLTEMLLADTIDAAIVYNSRRRAEVTNILEYEFPPMVAVARDHPLTKLESVRLEDCVKYPLAMPDESTYARNVLQRMFTDAGLNPRVALTTNSFETILSAAETGFAVGLTMGTHAKLFMRGNIEFLPLQGVNTQPSVLSFSVRTGRQHSPAMRAMVALIREELDAVLRPLFKDRRPNELPRKKEPREAIPT